MSFDWAFLLSTLPTFFKALGLTLEIGAISIALSLLVALLCCCVQVLKLPLLSPLVRAYVELARNTPVLIQLLFVYFALPSAGLKLSGFSAAIIALTFMGGAYLSEVLRAGIEAVPRAQIEAGQALGLSRWQQLRYVILPQAGVFSLPALFANFIYLLKETTVVSAVAVPELLYTTKSYIALYYKTYEMLAVMTALCVLLFVPLSIFLRLLEKRLRHAQFGN